MIFMIALRATEVAMSAMTCILLPQTFVYSHVIAVIFAVLEERLSRPLCMPKE